MMDIAPPEPLHPETWFDSLHRLADAIEDLDNAESESIIRMAYHLVRLTPAPLRHFFRSNIDEGLLEKMLECNAFESAIFGLLGPPMALVVSRDLHSEKFHAKVAIDDEEVCGSGEHSSVAKAGLSAWTKCLVKLSEVARRENQASSPA